MCHSGRSVNRGRVARLTQRAWRVDDARGRARVFLPPRNTREDILPTTALTIPHIARESQGTTFTIPVDYTSTVILMFSRSTPSVRASLAFASAMVSGSSSALLACGVSAGAAGGLLAGASTSSSGTRTIGG